MPHKNVRASAPDQGPFRKQEFSWSLPKEIAALDLAHGKISLPEVAANAGVSRATICRWRLVPEFAVRVSENREQLKKAILPYAIADVIERTKAKDRRWQALRELIASRAEAAAADQSLKDMPGATQGLLTSRQKMIGQGKQASLVTEHRFDRAVFRELGRLEMGAAKELGQLRQVGKLGATAPTRPTGLLPLDTCVTFGYPLGSPGEILEEFQELIKDNIDPVEYYSEQSRRRIEEDKADKAKKDAEAAVTGR